MNNLKYVKIGDIADIKGGKRLPKGRKLLNKVTPYPYLRVVDFENYGLNTSNIKYIDEETASKLNRYKISTNDIYISIAGTIGLLGMLPNSLSEAYLTENAAKITNIRSDIHKYFLLYYLRSPLGQNSILSKITGTSQPKLALYRIKEIEVPLFSFKYQQNIGVFLSKFDQLIKNKNQRMKVLEKIANLIYIEWFVNFRFPGHKNIKISNSQSGKIPEGWNIQKVGEVLSLNYGKALKKSDRKEGNIPVYGSSGIVGYHNKALVKGPGVIVGRKGNVGSVFWSDEDFYPIDTVYYVSSELPLSYLYYNLKDRQFINSDAAVPGLNRKYAYSLKIIVPPRDLMTRFSNIVENFHKQALILRKQIDNLKKTKDLLLPKLMSGEIDVSKLDIDTRGSDE